MIPATLFAFSANWCQQASWSAGSPCVPVYLASGKALLPMEADWLPLILPQVFCHRQVQKTSGPRLLACSLPPTGGTGSYSILHLCCVPQFETFARGCLDCAWVVNEWMGECFILNRWRAVSQHHGLELVASHKQAANNHLSLIEHRHKSPFDGGAIVFQGAGVDNVAEARCAHRPNGWHNPAGVV